MRGCWARSSSGSNRPPTCQMTENSTPGRLGQRPQRLDVLRGRQGDEQIVVAGAEHLVGDGEVAAARVVRVRDLHALTLRWIGVRHRVSRIRGGRSAATFPRW